MTLRLPVGQLDWIRQMSLRYAGYIYQTVFPRVILEAIYAPDEVWGRDYIYQKWIIIKESPSLEAKAPHYKEIWSDVPWIWAFGHMTSTFVISG